MMIGPVPLGLIFLTIGSYLLGSIPTGLWLGKAWKGIDVRQHGSGNLGATNVFRVLGAGPGAITLVIDVLKGFLPVLACQHWFPVPPWAALIVGLAAIIGHTMSVFVRFRGGKGVATSGGVFAALLPIPCAIAVGLFVIVFALTRIVSISSILAAIVLAGSSYWFSTQKDLMVAASVIALFVVWTHRANVRRLIKGTELPVTRSAPHERIS